MKKDLQQYLNRESHYFSEGHLMGWFNEQYKGKTKDENETNLKTNHDNSGEIENAEYELNRSLTSKEQKKLVNHFHTCVLKNLRYDDNGKCIGYIDSLEQFCTKGY